jgi:hypothetical protein
MKTAELGSIRLRNIIALSLRTPGALIIRLTRAAIAKGKALLARG